jgi:predicted DNA binding CopG/RHH family protein
MESPRSTKNIDFSKVVQAPPMPNLKASTVTVNLRMTIAMVNALKSQANKQDVPYQSYMKMLIARALKMKMA